MIKINKTSSRAEVLKAVKEGGDAFKNANKKFQDDKEIVLASINVWPTNLQFASKRLRKDKEIITTAFKLDTASILCADESLSQDHKFLKKLEKISSKIWFYVSSPEHDKELEIKGQKLRKEIENTKEKWIKEREKYYQISKSKLKKSLAHLFSFTYKNEYTMINLYAGGACFDIKDPINDKVINFWIGDDDDLYNKIKKTKNGLRFSTGRDMFYFSYLCVDKRGKVEKIFIETTPDVRDEVSENLDLVYNNQFVYQLSSNDQRKIENLCNLKPIRKKLSEVIISSGCIQIGQMVGNEKPSDKDKELSVIKHNAERAETIDSFTIPVKNKTYPVYAYVYNYSHEENGPEEELENNILIVVEDIEGCYLNKMTAKEMYFSNKPG